MSLTVADVERWDAGDVREVFHAASSRAQAAHDAADGIATLPALSTWGGVAAAAAKAAIGKTRRDLDAHGREATVVANAARSAAEQIERIQSELATVKGDAAAQGLEIDPVSGRVVAGAGFKGTAAELRLKQEQLQPRVDKLVVQANLVDLALANAIKMADGTTPIPSAPSPPNAPPGPLPSPVPNALAGNPADATPNTWKDMVLPPEAVGTVPTDAAPTLQDALFPPGTSVDPAGAPKNLDEALFPPGSPQPGPPPSMLDRINAQRQARGQLPLYPRNDPEFLAQGRELLAQQGVPADQIEQRLNATLAMMEQPVADYLPPEPVRQPAPGFAEGFRDRWFGNEQFVRNLLGQGGPGEPGVVESWKGVAEGVQQSLTNPVGVVKDEIDRAVNSPSAAYYAGEWGADLTQSAAASPILGPEALAGRTALRAFEHDLDIPHHGAAGNAHIGADDIGNPNLGHGYTGADHLPFELGSPIDTSRPEFDLSSPLDHLSPQLIHLSEQHLTGSGETVLGPYRPPMGGPSYIEVAQQNGASYFDIGDAWNTSTPTQQLAANQHVLDVAIANRDTITLSVPIDQIKMDTYTGAELRYLQSKGYEIVDSRTLVPPSEGGR